MSGQRFPMRAFATWLFAALTTASALAVAEDITRLPARDAVLTWSTSTRGQLLLSVSFRDAIDQEIRRKLTRGLPTTIVLIAALFRSDREPPIATTLQSCRVTWHVWEEAYRVELTQPGGVLPPEWTTTMEGVLRRCGEARKLPIAARNQVPKRLPLSVRAQVEINPVGEDLMQKLKAWVTRPVGSPNSAPGDALFGAFTGIFMQRIGKAERILQFSTRPYLPVSEAHAPGAKSE